MPPLAKVEADSTEEDSEQKASAVPNLRAIPLRHTKVIHAVRHGQGFHNVAGHKNLGEYLSPEWEDAHLTSYGWEQAEALHAHMGKLAEPLQVDLVVVSPLTRTLETAVGMFASETWQGNGKPLMAEQSQIEGHRIARRAMSADGCPPFLAVELCREHLGRHYCDKRRNLSHYKKQFPAVDFSLVETEEDTWWGPDFREEKEQIKARGQRFMQWLMTRPERHIAVVSHSSFLFFTMLGFGHHAYQSVQEEGSRYISPATGIQGELHRWYENCEMRSIMLSDDSGSSGTLDPLWFPGGNQLQREGAEPPKEKYEPPENTEPPPEVAVPSEVPEVVHS